MSASGRRHPGPDGAAVRLSLSTVRETPRYTYLVVAVAAVAAIGGMPFGDDIGVISGAENLLKADFRLSSTAEELAVAAVLIGAVAGGAVGGPLANRFSRRYTLLAMAVLYGAGAILTAVAWNLGSFLAFRILTGIAVGASSLVVPAGGDGPACTATWRRGLAPPGGNCCVPAFAVPSSRASGWPSSSSSSSAEGFPDRLRAAAGQNRTPPDRQARPALVSAVLVCERFCGKEGRSGYGARSRG